MARSMARFPLPFCPRGEVVRPRRPRAEGGGRPFIPAMPGLKPSPATQANHTSQPRLLSGPCHRICTSHHLATPSPLLLSDAAGLGLGVVGPLLASARDSPISSSSMDLPHLPIHPSIHPSYSVIHPRPGCRASIPIHIPSSHPRTHHTLPLHTRNLSILTSKHAPEGPGFPRPIFHTAASHRDDVFGVSTTRLRNTTYEQPHASHTPAPQHAHTYGFWS